MVRICAWCKRVLGHVEPYEDHRPTHTVCLACKKIHFPENELDDGKGGDACQPTKTQTK